MEDTPLVEISPAHRTLAGHAIQLSLDLRAFEQRAKSSLPGVPWDFSQLRTHFRELSGLLQAGLALKAHYEHQNFTVSPPGKLLAQLRGKPAEHLARRRGYVAGKVISTKKSASSRANLELARKKRRRLELPPEEAVAYGELRKIRRLIQRLKYREMLAQRTRQREVIEKRPRSDAGRRARRITDLQNQVAAIEKRWPRLRSLAPHRIAKSPQSEEWLIPPSGDSSADTSEVL